MLAKIKIVKISNSNKVSKNGKAYKSCAIKTLGKEGTEFWLNGFGNNTTESWVEGQTVELDCYEEEYNGTKSWKFKTPAETNIVELLKEINTKLDWLVSKKPQYPENPKGGSVPENEVDATKIPF